MDVGVFTQLTPIALQSSRTGPAHLGVLTVRELPEALIKLKA
jgi:hypothetical protein